MPVTGLFKDRLMGALQTAVQHFNQDATDPNIAVVKAAQAYDFNADQTTRLVETFNTARTIYHYKSASDRTAPFVLADAGVVIPTLFKPAEKAASVPVTDHDYACYDMPEAHFEDGMLLDKEAVQGLDLGQPTEYLDTNLETQAERACQAIHVQRDLAKTARDEAGVAATKAAQILGKIASEISLSYEEDAKDCYARLTAAYAEDGEFAPVVAKLAEFVPDHLQSEPSVDLVIDDRDLANHVEHMKEAREWMQAESEMLAVAGTLDKEADAFEREWMEAISPALAQPEVASIADFINPGLRKAAGAAELGRVLGNGGNGGGGSSSGMAPMLGWASKSKNDEKQDKQPDKKDGYSLSGAMDTVGKSVANTPIARGVSGAVEEGYRESLGAPAASAIDSGINKALGAPTEGENMALSERLKNVQRKLLVEDLMVNDPVLSEEDPQVVANAYQAVLQMAPEVASNKEVVRAILRQVVHSVAIGTFDAQSWTELEKNLMNITGKADRPGGGGGSGGAR